MAEPLLGQPQILKSLENVESAARELDAMFHGNVGRWTLAGREIPTEVSDALLSLHDYLNDVQREREGL